MSESQKRARIELPPEAEPARGFIEALVDRYEKRVGELEANVADLTQKLKKLTPRNSSLPPSSEHPHAKPKPMSTELIVNFYAVSPDEDSAPVSGRILIACET